MWPVPWGSGGDPAGRGEKPGTRSRIGRCFGDVTPQDARETWHDWEGPMAARRHDQIIETPTEARQGEPGPSVLALLTISTGLAMLILGVVWFVFFRT